MRPYLPVGMALSALLATNLLPSSLLSATRSKARPAPMPLAGQEQPPQRARVQVGDEVLELALDGSTGTLSDGRRVTVELLPTRRFSLPDSFVFEYPDGWRYSASVGSPTAVDGWWTLGGERVHLYLRRHGGEAAAILEEYLANSLACGATDRRATTLELGGRTLEGYTVEQEIGSIGYSQPTHARMQIVTWQERPGVAWLLQIQRDTPRRTPMKIDLTSWQGLDLSSGLTDAAKPSPPQPDPGFETVAASFRWAGG